MSFAGKGKEETAKKADGNGLGESGDDMIREAEPPNDLSLGGSLRLLSGG